MAGNKDDKERSDDEDEDEDENEEGLSDEERRKRRFKKEVKEKVEKSLGKGGGGRVVDDGFMDAFRSDSANKFIRRHNFHYGAEPAKDRVPETKPSAVTGGEAWTEPSSYVPPTKPVEQKQPEKSLWAYLQAEEKQNIEHADRREQPNGENQIDVRSKEAHISDKRKDYSSEDDIATVEVEAPLKTAHEVTSRIASKLEDEGYEHVATEIETPDAAEEDLARIEAQAKDEYAPATWEQKMEFINLLHDPEKVDALLWPSDMKREAAEEDTISPLELNEQHEKIRKKAIGGILDQQRQELMEDFELTPSNLPVEEEEGEGY